MGIALVYGKLHVQSVSVLSFSQKFVCVCVCVIVRVVVIIIIIIIIII